jgi:hypothetical protein
VGARVISKLTRTEREQIAAKRIVNVLRAQGVANLRTLEQKIADAGPNPQRVQPHILTPVKARMVKDGRLVQRSLGNAQWLHLAEENPRRVADRLNELQPLWTELTEKKTTGRTGQALEVATFRAIVTADGVTPYGGFFDLEAHGDDRAYSKEDIHNFNGRSLNKRSLDFLVAVAGDHCGIEVKNIRPWIYPHAEEVRETIDKALTLGVIPVLVARRIPYATFRILGACGVIMHETYTQLMANADAALAAKVRHKDLLGYHDVRVGNEPDVRLTKFISENLPSLVPEARKKLVVYGDLLKAFATGVIVHKEFEAQVHRRNRGQNEDADRLATLFDEDHDPYDLE